MTNSQQSLIYNGGGGSMMSTSTCTCDTCYSHNHRRRHQPPSTSSVCYSRESGISMKSSSLFYYPSDDQEYFHNFNPSSASSHHRQPQFRTRALAFRPNYDKNSNYFPNNRPTSFYHVRNNKWPSNSDKYYDYYYYQQPYYDQITNEVALPPSNLSLNDQSPSLIFDMIASKKNVKKSKPSQPKMHRTSMHIQINQGEEEDPANFNGEESVYDSLPDDSAIFDQNYDYSDSFNVYDNYQTPSEDPYHQGFYQFSHEEPERNEYSESNNKTKANCFLRLCCLA